MKEEIKLFLEKYFSTRKGNFIPSRKILDSCSPVTKKQLKKIMGELDYKAKLKRINSTLKRGYEKIQKAKRKGSQKLGVKCWRVGCPSDFEGFCIITKDEEIRDSQIINKKTREEKVMLCPTCGNLCYRYIHSRMDNKEVKYKFPGQPLPEPENPYYKRLQKKKENRPYSTDSTMWLYNDKNPF